MPPSPPEHLSSLPRFRFPPLDIDDVPASLEFSLSQLILYPSPLDAQSTLSSLTEFVHFAFITVIYSSVLFPQIHDFHKGRESDLFSTIPLKQLAQWLILNKIY